MSHPHRAFDRLLYRRERWVFLAAYYSTERSELVVRRNLVARPFDEQATMTRQPLVVLPLDQLREVALSLYAPIGAPPSLGGRVDPGASPNTYRDLDVSGDEAFALLEETTPKQPLIHALVYGWNPFPRTVGMTSGQGSWATWLRDALGAKYLPHAPAGLSVYEDLFRAGWPRCPRTYEEVRQKRGAVAARAAVTALRRKAQRELARGSAGLTPWWCRGITLDTDATFLWSGKPQGSDHADRYGYSELAERLSIPLSMRPDDPLAGPNSSLVAVRGVLWPLPPAREDTP